MIFCLACYGYLILVFDYGLRSLCQAYDFHVKELLIYLRVNPSQSEWFKLDLTINKYVFVYNYIKLIWTLTFIDVFYNDQFILNRISAIERALCKVLVFNKFYFNVYIMLCVKECPAISMITNSNVNFSFISGKRCSVTRPVLISTPVTTLYLKRHSISVFTLFLLTSTLG